MTSPALLGIDGGGTNTTAWLGDHEGCLLGRGRAGPSNVKSVGTKAALDALNQAIERAFADADAAPGPVEVACLGLAGYDRPDDRRLLEQWSARHQWARRLVLVNDGDLVIAAGTPEGWGVGVIAGTGSIAVGRWPDGRTARAGGWGYLIGDEGSAYAVAIAGLRWVAHREDGRVSREIHDVLTERICEALGIAGPSDLVSAVYAPGFDRSRIAAIAPVIVAAAEDDRFVAENILLPAANDLAELASTVAKRLGWHEWDNPGPLPLAMAGGFLLASPIVSDALIASLRQMGYQVAATRVPEPVSGAIALAHKALET